MKSVIEVISNSDEYNDLKIITSGLNTIIATTFSRQDLSKYANCKHSKKPGVYILYNETSTNDQSIYIGEAENIISRLRQHEKSFGKIFWTHTIVFQEIGDKLNKAHFKNLEYLTYNAAITANRVSVINKTIPTKSSVSIADEYYIDQFFDCIKKILGALNYKFLEPKVLGYFEEDLDIYYFHYHGALGKLRVISDNEMILLKGSTCIYKTIDDMPKNFYDLLTKRDYMIKNKDISFVEDTNLIILNKDIKFDSENEACAFICLRSDIDGDLCWENMNGYKIYENKK